jgi:hypothetical protein
MGERGRVSPPTRATQTLPAFGAQAQDAEKSAAQNEERDDSFSRPGPMSSEDTIALAEARIAALKGGFS